MGLDVNSDFIGWNGNSTLSVETVLESIVTLKKKTVLPEVSIEFKKDKEMIIKRAEVKFDNVWYPLGRCLRVIYPEESENAILSGIILTITKDDNFEEKDFVVDFMDTKSGKRYR